MFLVLCSAHNIKGISKREKLVSKLLDILRVDAIIIVDGGVSYDS